MVGEMFRVPVALEKPENQLRLLLAVVLSGLVLIIPQVAKYFGDEAYYTDAAIQMVRTGDYWTPYYPDGRMRFVKPILTYWAIVASYLVLGINFFSSRFAFVLAGRDYKAAAHILGVHEKSMHKLLKKLGLDHLRGRSEAE